MNTDDNNKNNHVNTFVETGVAVTSDDALDWERSERKAAADRYHEAAEKQRPSNTIPGASLKQSLLQNVAVKLQAQIDEQKYSGNNMKAFWFKNGIERVDVELMADMALGTVMDNVQDGASLRQVQEKLGDAYVCLLFEQTMSERKAGRRLMARLDKRVIERTSDMQWRQDIVFSKARLWGFDLDAWTERERVKVGTILLNSILMATSMVTITKLKKFSDDHPTRYVVMTPEGEQFFKEHHDLLADFASYRSPMIWPPRAWTLDSIGPYLSYELAVHTPLVRNMSPDQKAKVDELRRSGDLNAVQEAASFIQDVPLTINQYVVDAVEWVKEDIDRASQLAKFPNLKRSPAVKRLKPEEFNKKSKKEQIQYAREYQEVMQDNIQAGANAIIVDRRIGQARKLSQVERFWLPHNFDYRGRVYHIPDFGHHQTDFTRAMILFANGDPIGAADKWLKRHIANCFGLDKETMEERERWVDDNKDAIYACGREFVGSFPFWKKAKEPLQFLAGCREWFNYTNHGPDYVSGLPIGQDATQSGIQHFAAASLNPVDGYEVNLTDNDKPSDFYQTCLNEAKDLIVQDQARFEQQRAEAPWTEEDEEALIDYQAFMAQEMPEDKDEKEALEKEKSRRRTAFRRTETHRKHQREQNYLAGKQVLALGDEYDRSKIKRNAMTFAYSSNVFGMAEQLRDDWMSELARDVRLKVLDEHPFGEDQGYHAAFYLAETHNRAIRNVVSSADKGMEFLRRIAEILADDAGETVKVKGKGKSAKTREVPQGKHFAFMNKIGFPFYQYYRHGTSHSQKVFLFDRPTQKFDKENQSYFRKYSTRVEKSDSMDGISPNTIHCQDACHLLKTALACKEQGVKNVLFVHDSFATTIAHSDTLWEATREQFKHLYEGYCLFEDVLEQAKAIHSAPETVQWPTIPAKGHQGKLLDLNEVLRSRYMFN